jgi:hypothetical protein
MYVYTLENSFPINIPKFVKQFELWKLWMSFGNMENGFKPLKTKYLII